MLIDRYFFVVWAHRNARSIFGAASKPVLLNGKLLCFRAEEQARLESDRLNARTGSSHVRYRVRPVRVQMRLPGGLAQGKSAERQEAATPRAA